MRKRTFVTMLLWVIACRASSQELHAVPLDSAAIHRLVIVRDSTIADLRSALSNPRRQIFLNDIQYRTSGPITSFRDGRFRVWDTRVYVPLDSVAGLYEYWTHGAQGAAIGFGAVVATALMWFLPPLGHNWSDDYGSFIQAGVAFTLLGWFVGSHIEERHYWPVEALR